MARDSFSRENMWASEFIYPKAEGADQFCTIMFYLFPKKYKQQKRATRSACPELNRATDTGEMEKLCAQSIALI